MHFWWLGNSPQKTPVYLGTWVSIKCRDQICDWICAVHMTYIVLTSWNESNFNWSLVLKCQVESDLWALPGLNWFLNWNQCSVFTSLIHENLKSTFNHRFFVQAALQKLKFVKGFRNERHSKIGCNSRRTKIQNLSSIK